MNHRVRCLVLVLASGTACTRTLTLTRSTDAGSNTQLEDGSVAPPEAGLAVDEAGVTLCGKAPCACANGADDDGDGLIDGFDPECTAPFDDDEQTFATGVHGEDQNDKCRDCFFDGNTGSGDDDCKVASTCSTNGEARPGACRSCEASEGCQAACLPLVPNGCACFGCCEVRQAGRVVSVLLQNDCSLARLDDIAACPRCTPIPSCFNPCGECELCAGKSPLALPEACGGEGQYVCEGAPRCAADTPCVRGDYCVQGCCVPLLY